VVAGTLGLQAAAMTVPGLRNVLGLTALSMADWAMIAGASTLPLLLNELRRQGDNDGIASEASNVH
jgi:Cation transporting ATPase, C-terminus